MYGTARYRNYVYSGERRKLKSDSYVTSDVYIVYLSGSGFDAREWAGVGFVISPRFKSCFYGFNLSQIESVV